MQATTKRSKQRHLSPSFKKGAVKNKNQNDDFKIDLLVNNAQQNMDDDVQHYDQDGEAVNASPVHRKHSHHDDKDKSKHKTKKHKQTSVVVDSAQMNDLEYQTSQLKLETTEKIINIKNLFAFSQAGKGEDGFTKVNQDSLLSVQRELKLQNFHIFAVLDGHGACGHLISQYVSKYIGTRMHKSKRLNALDNETDVYKCLTKNDYEFIKQMFRHAEKDLSKNEIDATFSGTTCVLVLLLNNKLICANIGDSRAILVTKKKIVKLSIDQKPNDPLEMARIIKNGGEVSQFEDEGVASGPYRVWKKGEAYPGIAMSRSIGDLIATSLGVIPVPEFVEFELNDDTLFIVMASDGIWEFISNEKVKEMVMPFYEKKDPHGAGKALIAEATRYWEEEDIVVDDITVIVVFF